MKKIFSLILSCSILLSSIPLTKVSAANVEETIGTQLQTILIDNDGKNLWTTESWGGQNLTPNTSWTTSDWYDYFYNGELSFDVKSNTGTDLTFYVGLTSHSHNETVTIRWTDLEQYKNKVVATSDWTSYSFSLKELVDAFPDSGFDKHNVWKVAVGGISTGNTASFQNVKVTSTDEERQYPFIKINQEGYTCQGSKDAKVSYYPKFGSLEGKTYEIVNENTEEVVYSDILTNPVENDKVSGETVYDMDFDAVTQAGTYYIRISDADLDASVLTPRDIEEGLDTDTIVSYSFEIGDDVYDDLMTDVLKYYYYQRQGIDLDEKYAGVFARENLHPNDVTVKKWSDRDNPNAETFDVSQGWYDAGDYGKYVVPAATSVEDLLMAYELYPEVFENIDTNIPETDSGNELYTDAPAILSEVKWELDMLLKLEHADKDGSFYVAANYKDGVIYIEDTLYSSSDYNSDENQKDLRSHLATIDMAAMLAHAYIVYKDIPVYADFAQQCLDTAVRAWNWVNDASNEKHMSIGAANRTYTFKEDELERSTYWAAGSLYRAMKLAGQDTSEYENYLISNCDTENNTYCFSSSSLGYTQNAESLLGYFNYLYENDNPNEKISNTFQKFETWRTRILNYDSYGTDYPDWGYWWGSNKVYNHCAMALLLGSMIVDGEDSVSEEVMDSTQNAFNYMLGVNPISFSYVSGHGENCVKNIYSGIFTKDAKLDPYQCPDGYVTEGANSNNNRYLSKYNAKCYMDSDSEYTTNENTLYGNAAFILLAASVISRTEQMEESVQGDVNADGIFNLADLTMVQKYLIKTGSLADWEKADLDDNGIINGLDLALMRNALL